MLYNFTNRYAGHYIPAIAAEINNNNKGTSSWILSRPEGLQDLLHINLKSILIGNGLVDPLVQYEYYPQVTFVALFIFFLKFFFFYSINKRYIFLI
jgi:carboxypeptidase C (cathepsin A)